MSEKKRIKRSLLAHWEEWYTAQTLAVFTVGGPQIKEPLMQRARMSVTTSIGCVTCVMSLIHDFFLSVGQLFTRTKERPSLLLVSTALQIYDSLAGLQPGVRKYELYLNDLPKC